MLNIGKIISSPNILSLQELIVYQTLEINKGYKIEIQFFNFVLNQLGPTLKVKK